LSGTKLYLLQTIAGISSSSLNSVSVNGCLWVKWKETVLDSELLWFI